MNKSLWLVALLFTYQMQITNFEWMDKNLRNERNESFSYFLSFGFISSPQLPVHIFSSAPCSLTYHLSSYKRNPLSAKSSVSPTKVSTKFPQEIKVKIHQLFTFTTDGSMTSAAELILKKEVMNRKLVPKMILVWWKRRKSLLL